VRHRGELTVSSRSVCTSAHESDIKTNTGESENDRKIRTEGDDARLVPYTHNRMSSPSDKAEQHGVHLGPCEGELVETPLALQAPGRQTLLSNARSGVESAIPVEELKSGGSCCELQRDDWVLCDRKTIRTMYNLARSWYFEDAAWNHESRECKTRQAQKQHD